MNAEKPISPGTVTLDPRADENADNLPRTPARAPAAPEGEAEIIVPDVIEPVVLAPEHPKPDAPGESDKSDKPRPE